MKKLAVFSACSARRALSATLIYLSAIGGASGESGDLPVPGELTLEQRLLLSCPSSTETGPFQQPSELLPVPEIPFRKMYSDAGELVRHIGVETSAYTDFKGGDDIAFLYEAETGALIVTGAGNDTVVLCSMNDLNVIIILGDEAMTPDLGVDVVVIEQLVFEAIPEGMRREIAVFNFNQETDHLKIRAPQHALGSLQIGPQVGGFKFEDVTVRVLPVISSPLIDFQSDAFVVTAAE